MGKQFEAELRSKEMYFGKQVPEVLFVYLELDEFSMCVVAGKLW